MNYQLKPGKKIEIIGELEKKYSPIISIITPFYNGGATLEETVNSVLSQTYPFFEWIIVDDGSKDEESLKKLEQISHIDQRIKVYHKENGGPSQARDFGIKKSSKSSKYIYFIDCDDLIENTMLEVLYWTLETHPDASFAYTTMVNFGDKEFIWEKYLTVEQQKKENLICISSMVKKEDLLEVGCFGIKEKSMYEDWNLWLKLIEKGKKPIRVNAPIFWYRISNSGEFSRAQKNHEQAMKYVNETASKIKHDVEIIQFPREGELFPKVNSHKMTLPTYKKNKKNKLLFILPWAMIGGADLFNLELLKRINHDNFEIIVITTLPNNNELRHEFSQYCTEFYDLTTFLERKDFILFVDYLIDSRKIDLVMISNSKIGYYMAPYLKSKHRKLKIVDYIHSIDLKDPKGAFGRCSMDIDSYLDATYCCNNFTKQQLEKDFYKKNVKTLYIGTDENRYDPKKYNGTELKEKYGIPKDKKIVSFIGRLSDEKRPSTFVKIGKQLLKERQDVFFIIAGDGYLFHNIKKEITEDFKMLGTITKTEEIYAISDITVNCSSLEGLALTSFESLSMDVPIVSTDVGGQTELIDNKVGKIIHYEETNDQNVLNQEIEEYVNAINEILNNLNKYKNECRKKIIKKFTLNEMIKNISKEFIDIINNDSTKTNSVDFLEYELALESLFPDYYYCTKNYIESKFNINYPPNKKQNKETFTSKIKSKCFNYCENKNVVKEGKNILNFIYLTYHISLGLLLKIIKTLCTFIRDIIYFIKFLILLIPSVFKIILSLGRK